VTTVGTLEEAVTILFQPPPPLPPASEQTDTRMGRLPCTHCDCPDAAYSIRLSLDSTAVAGAAGQESAQRVFDVRGLRCAGLRFHPLLLLLSVCPCRSLLRFSLCLRLNWRGRMPLRKSCPRLTGSFLPSCMCARWQCLVVLLFAHCSHYCARLQHAQQKYRAAVAVKEKDPYVVSRCGLVCRCALTSLHSATADVC
jgi:hypothetical protein